MFAFDMLVRSIMDIEYRAIRVGSRRQSTLWLQARIHQRSPHASRTLPTGGLAYMILFSYSRPPPASWSEESDPVTPTCMATSFSTDIGTFTPRWRQIARQDGCARTADEEGRATNG